MVTNLPSEINQKLEVNLQREYYKKTAHVYDSTHLNENPFPLRLLEAAIDFYHIRSILDVGAGTGNVARYLKEKHPEIKVISVEPVSELREVGYSAGLSENELIDGDINKLNFSDAEFDLVCEFSVLHHIKEPSIAIAEMLRVSKLGIFISDSNNFGAGSFLLRTIKQLLNTFNLWKLVDFIKTKGKGYWSSAGDGISYSYSVFNNYKQIANRCHVYLFSVEPSGKNLYRTAHSVALLGVKKDQG
ncbi:MAG: class I SAM-dependent methyltransferase [Sulfobacillus sp.]